MKDISTIRAACLRYMLRPVVRFCLSGSHTIQDAIDALKVVFIEVAAEELSVREKKVNVSRLSIVTGIHREEVRRIYHENREPLKRSASLLARVLGQWEQDKRFHSATGQPKTLSYHGKESEFWKLVTTVTTTINPATVLFGLEQIGAARKTRSGIKLRKGLRGMAQDPQKGFELLARDVESLITSVEQNIFGSPQIKNLHIRTEYDNIVQSELPAIRQWLLDEGKAFHKRAREYLSSFDRDINPTDNADETSGARVVVSAFSLTSQI